MLCFGPGHVSNFCRAESAALSRRERVEEHNRVKYLAGLLDVSCSWVRTAERLGYTYEEMKDAVSDGTTDKELQTILSEAGLEPIFRSGERALNIVAPPVTRRAT